MKRVLLVPIDQSCIDHGTPADGGSCMVALGLRALGYSEVHVTDEYVEIYEPHPLSDESWVPDEDTSRAIIDFDNPTRRTRLRPFTAKLVQDVIPFSEENYDGRDC